MTWKKLLLAVIVVLNAVRSDSLNFHRVAKKDSMITMMTLIVRNKRLLYNKLTNIKSIGRVISKIPTKLFSR